MEEFSGDEELQTGPRLEYSKLILVVRTFVSTLIFSAYLLLVPMKTQVIFLNSGVNFCPRTWLAFFSVLSIYEVMKVILLGSILTRYKSNDIIPKVPNK